MTLSDTKATHKSDSRVARVLKLIQRATRQAPVLATALSKTEQAAARESVRCGEAQREKFDEGIGYFSASKPSDEGHEL